MENRRVVFFNDKQQKVQFRGVNALVEHFYKHGQVVVKFRLHILLAYLSDVIIEVQLLAVAEKEVYGTKNLYLDFVRGLLAALKEVTRWNLL